MDSAKSKADLQSEIKNTTREKCTGFQGWFAWKVS